MECPSLSGFRWGDNPRLEAESLRFRFAPFLDSLPSRSDDEHTVEAQSVT